MRAALTRRTAVLALVLLLVSGCATSMKQKVSMGHQLVRESLVAADDTERALCLPDPVTPTICTSPMAATAGLTDARHQQFSRHLVEAFRHDVRAGTAIILWKTGEPMPSTIPELLAAVQQALVDLDGVVASTLVEQVQKVVDQIRDLLQLFGGAQ